MEPHRRTRNNPPSRPQETLRPVASADIIYFGRGPWDGVKGRGHHIVGAIAQQRRIFYVEPPVPERTGCIDIDITCRGAGLFVVTPHLIEGTSDRNAIEALRFTINQLVERFHLRNPILWYETALALSFTRHLDSLIRVYDYPRRSAIAVGSEAEAGEAELLRIADIIFTSTQSVFETVRRLRPGAVFFFPDCPESSTLEHPATPRTSTPRATAGEHHRIVGSIVPPDSAIDHPLLEEIAFRRPDLSFEIIGGPTPTEKPSNVMYRGELSRAEAEALIRRWDAAIFPIQSHRGRAPFPIATIGEIVRCGVPVVATPTTDIVGPLGRRRVIQLAQTGEEFIAALEYASEQRMSETWRKDCNRLLSEWTWTRTALQMLDVIGAAVEPYTYPALPEQQAVGFSW